jgi:hypothetical protein
MSFDGFTSGENERLDWLVPHATTPEGHAAFRRLRERIDTVLVGRVNYEGYFAYWPKVKNDPKASPDDKALSVWLDEIPKVVFSCWSTSRRLTGDYRARRRQRRNR